MQVVLWAGCSQKEVHIISSYVIGQDMVTRPHQIARKSERCVVMCPGKKSNQPPFLHLSLKVIF